MADVITLKNGRNEVVFDERGFLDLVDEHMGPEARRWLEGWLAEGDDASDYIGDLEKEADSLRAHHKDVMAQLRQSQKRSPPSSGKKRSTAKPCPRQQVRSELSLGGS